MTREPRLSPAQLCETIILLRAARREDAYRGRVPTIPCAVSRLRRAWWSLQLSLRAMIP